MKHILMALVLLLIAVPMFAAVETWKNAPLIDSMCADKMKANPDEHQAACALGCAKAGSALGILTPDGAFLRFDPEGTKKAVAELQKTKKQDHIRATVTGERSGDTIKVQSLTLD